MRVFVLCTGRCGSKTFVQACRHIHNFTAGHETRAGLFGAARLEYPDGHIEADNRLSWFLGPLDRRFGGEAFYVHLRRDSEQVARSFLRRFGQSRVSIIDAFAHAIVMQEHEWPAADRLDLCRAYVETINENIALFLRDKPRKIEVQVERAAEDFARFWDAIGARGDRAAALAEWTIRHNRSAPEAPSPRGSHISG
jgi:hypothetical protein